MGKQTALILQNYTNKGIMKIKNEDIASVALTSLVNTGNGTLDDKLEVCIVKI